MNSYSDGNNRKKKRVIATGINNLGSRELMINKALCIDAVSLPRNCYVLCNMHAPQIPQYRMELSVPMSGCSFAVSRRLAMDLLLMPSVR
jgi:hypothetical protein